jgi:hypothetical protein
MSELLHKLSNAEDMLVPCGRDLEPSPPVVCQEQGLISEDIDLITHLFFCRTSRRCRWCCAGWVERQLISRRVRRPLDPVRLREAWVMLLRSDRGIIRFCCTSSCSARHSLISDIFLAAVCPTDLKSKRSTASSCEAVFDGSSRRLRTNHVDITFLRGCVRRYFSGKTPVRYILNDESGTVAVDFVQFFFGKKQLVALE